MPNPRKQDRELDEMYDGLPRLECQGYCHDSCGPIDMSIRERGRIVERARKPIACGTGASCSMLTEDRRCSVYEIRPLICRLWGLVRKMRCPYGCEPERWLTDAEALNLMIKAEAIGGSPKGARVQRLGEMLLGSLTEEQLASLVLRASAEPATLDGRLATLHRTGVRAPFEIPGISVGETAMAYPPQTRDAG